MKHGDGGLIRSAPKQGAKEGDYAPVLVSRGIIDGK